MRNKSQQKEELVHEKGENKIHESSLQLAQGNVPNPLP